MDGLLKGPGLGVTTYMYLALVSQACFSGLRSGGYE